MRPIRHTEKAERKEGSWKGRRNVCRKEGRMEGQKEGRMEGRGNVQRKEGRRRGKKRQEIFKEEDTGWKEVK